MNKGKTFIDVSIAEDSLFPERIVRVRLQDVIHYYVHDARNISSGCRTIAGVTGDWRNIDCIATHCLEWFKSVNVEGIRREARKRGIEYRY